MLKTNKLGKSILGLGLLFSVSVSMQAKASLQDNFEADSFASDLFAMNLVDASMERLTHKVTYDGSYRKIAYPWGDVPDNIGVCTDVVIRAYRKLGIDLQQRVHKDMWENFRQYPNLIKWDRTEPDTNIDHRRVLNLRVFFARKGVVLPASKNPKNYKPGDLVTWNIMPGMPHIGIVTNKLSADHKRPLIVHNMGKGPKLDDILFSMPITGHYRYQPIR